jgi:hypothetical protein
MERLDLSEARETQRESLPAAVLRREKIEQSLSPDSAVDQTINDVIVEEEVSINSELYCEIENLDSLLSTHIEKHTDGQEEERSASGSKLWTAEGLFSFLFSNGISYFNIETKDRRVLQAPRSFLAGLVHDSLRQLTFNVFKSMRAFMNSFRTNQSSKAKDT